MDKSSEQDRSGMRFASHLHSASVGDSGSADDLVKSSHEGTVDGWVLVASPSSDERRAREWRNDKDPGGR